MKIVIMAGGSGTRLWPRSRQNKPKQFTKVIGNKTMIEDTYSRFEGFYETEDIYFSTIPEFADRIKDFFPQVPLENILVEPEKRDNAAAHGYVAAVLAKKYGDEPMAFIPADHYIEDVVRFHKSLNVAENMIKKEGKMMDIGIEPDYPSTALGYTRIGKRVLNEEGIEVFRFKGHTEKPVFKMAKKYLAKGDYLWHGNYYMWTPNKFLTAYEKYAPEIYQKLAGIKEALQKEDHEQVALLYSEIEKTSIDYAITEKMDPKEVLIIRGEFGWSDIGAWDALKDLLKPEEDANQNYAQGKWVGKDTSGTYISGNPQKLIATVGVDDLIIVDTDDALLVCPRSKAQEVKSIVEELKDRGEIDYL
ncbi:mannose-1-phosphate guanylyltransferase [Patescibacteria group bacterium]|nr:mannose-1-phosphate guanylyltransferase [Patescibacteria group bacterium]